MLIVSRNAFVENLFVMKRAVDEKDLEED